ncbi:MAG: hypothetical protein ACREVK_03975 [Gammaproteobacteria bacterium]
MTPEQRQEVVRRLEQREDLSPEWAKILFPPEKREYELVYHGKEREEDILANTLAVPSRSAHLGVTVRLKHGATCLSRCWR